MPDRIKDFPEESLQCLDDLLDTLQKEALTEAIKIANREDPDPERYTVSTYFVLRGFNAAVRKRAEGVK